MKVLSIIIMISLFGSCSSKDKNPSGIDSKKMTEEDIYSIYGLEAPLDVYTTIDSIFSARKFEHDKICEENVKSPIVGVAISFDGMKINETKIKPSDYPVEINEYIRSAFTGLSRRFSFYEKGASHYNFHLNLKKFCGSKIFTKTTLKDSTLKTQPRLTKSLEESKRIKHLLFDSIKSGR